MEGSGNVPTFWTTSLKAKLTDDIFLFLFESDTQVVIKLSVIVMPLYNPTRPVASMRVFLAVLILLIAHEGTYAKPKPKPEPKPKPVNVPPALW